MIRRVQMSLSDANDRKKVKLDLLMDEALRVLSVFVDELWERKRFVGSFTDLDTETWLSARMKQCLGKQALDCVKSQRKRHKKTKPTIKKPTLTLDQRFIKFGQDENAFDFWVTLASLGARLKIVLPSKKHAHFNSFVEDGWEMRKSGRLRKTEKGWFFDVYFEKDAPPKDPKGKKIGVDCGYKKLIATSDGEMLGEDIEQCYEKIARKARGSKAYGKALEERDNLTNRAVNKINLADVGTIIVEGLHNVKKNSKGKIRKQFNNKLQYWSYRKCFAKLQSLCERAGIYFVEVDPAYTSQTCSACGHVDGNSRKGESFLCTGCGMKMDADYNAARNILMRGTYSSPSVQAIP